MCNSPEVGLEGQLCHLPLGWMTTAIPLHNQWIPKSTRAICGRSDSMLVLSQGHVFLLTLPTQLPPYMEKSLPKQPLVQRTRDKWSSPKPVHSLKQSCLFWPERKINGFFFLRFLVTCYAALMQQKPNAVAMDSALTEEFCCSLGENVHSYTTSILWV